jgi:hypothetical protein
MKLRLLLLVLTASFCQCAFAQVLNFKLIDLLTEKPLESVEVFSHEAHDKVNFTDKNGNVAFDIDHTDTLIFFKQGYAPLYIQIHRVNFDHSHALVLKMRSSTGNLNRHTAGQFDKLQKSKYTFVHDSLDNSSIHVTHFEHPDVAPIPNQQDKAFHIAQINLEGDSPSRNRSAYSLGK